MNELDVVLSGPLALLSLALALYVELDHLDGDGKEASRWLKNTEIGTVLASSNTLEDIDNYYYTVAVPLLSRYLDGRPSLSASKPELESFYHAYSLVSSRAFLVDAYHGLSMVPIADAFNHTQENHVHLETEFNVCAQCGSLYECPHDTEDSNTLRPVDRRNITHPATSEEFDSFYEMVSNASISPGEEVFNTYGETLTNAELLCRYGFILDANENDRVHLDFSDILNITTDLSNSGVQFTQTEADWDMIIQRFGDEGVYSLVSESSLIYYEEGNHGRAFSLDADGRVSHRLWTVLALPLCLRVDRSDIGNAINLSGAHLKAFLEFQLIVEAADETYDGRLAAHQLSDEIAVLARTVMNLCATRKARSGSQQLHNTGDLNDLLDNLPMTNKCTRDALTLVIGEQSILDSCIAAWDEILLALQ
ncbi:hypothetical protein H0H92_000735 [Tricholoma furcatifolium]|nr:hypothetical protein H0H92_000735 [Tricholoma furcatifolium]